MSEEEEPVAFVSHKFVQCCPFFRRKEVENGALLLLSWLAGCVVELATAA